MVRFVYLASFDIQSQVAPQVVFHLFGQPVNDTTIIGWGVSLALVILAISVSRRLQLVPSGLQNAVELLFENLIDMTDGLLAGTGKKLLPFIATIALFIGISNLVGILPLIKNPTADLNMTAAFGISVFIFSHVYAVLRKGLVRHLKSFSQPFLIMLPINLVGELAKPISHSFRLFGNIFGGGVIIALVAHFVPGIMPVPLMAWFDIFIGVVQALIFTMLAIAYVAIASE